MIAFIERGGVRVVTICLCLRSLSLIDELALWEYAIYSDTLITDVKRDNTRQ